MTRAELVIFDAAQEVERAGADVRLTDAINLLHQAREKVGDFVDGIAPAPPEQPARGDGVRLVESAKASGRYVHVITYHDGPNAPIRAQLLFRSPETARRCARLLSEALLDDAPGKDGAQ